MIARLCCSVLLSLLGLLTVATPTAAEWVLWETSGMEKPGEPDRWSPTDGFPTIGDCRSQMDRLVALGKQDPAAKRFKDNVVSNVVFFKLEDGRVLTKMYLCYPLPLDPRGPTGR